MGSWYYKWSKHIVKEPMKIPEHPHFVVLIFKDHSYTTPGYGRDDPDDHHTIKVVDYYAFVEKEKWEEMITDVFTERQTATPSFYSGKEEVVFFHSSGRGKVNIKIDVKISE